MGKVLKVEFMGVGNAYHTLCAARSMVWPCRDSMGFLIESRLKETLAEIDQKLNR